MINWNERTVKVDDLSPFERNPRKISESQYKKLVLKIWGNPCFYCDKPLEFTGLDRANNNLGYIPGNVVACCRLCNRMKFRSTQEDFLKRIGRL